MRSGKILILFGRDEWFVTFSLESINCMYILMNKFDANWMERNDLLLLINFLSVNVKTTYLSLQLVNVASSKSHSDIKSVI